MSKKHMHHHGLVARLAGDDHGPTHIERIEPICVAHEEDERCAVGVCDEVVYEAPATAVGWSPSPNLDANWARTFGRSGKPN